MPALVSASLLSLRSEDAVPSSVTGIDFENGWPRWAVMWAIAFGLFVVAKALSYWPARNLRSSPARLLGYFCVWPGLDARTFLSTQEFRGEVSAKEWCFAFAKMSLGLSLLLVGSKFSDVFDCYVVGWLGMLGFVFALHFGLFHLLSCYWRSRGVNAQPLMDWPIRSKSVSEFWGKRWNRAFRDLTHQFVFRPLVARLGPTVGSLSAFLFSGWIHELAITVPAGAGYGGPTAYFLLQGVGLLVERSQAGKRLGLGVGSRGRLFALAVIVLPVGLLFPRPFVVGIVAELLRALGTYL
jgi:hypothetical protein